MARNIGFMDISASLSLPPGVAPVVSSIVGIITGSLNVRKRRQRALYNQLISGGTGSLFEINDIPGWTQSYAKKNHGFVAPALSSSRHEVSELNAFNSGTTALETTQIPASGTLYYSKQSRYVTKVYKLSASAGLPDIPGTTNDPALRAGASHFDTVSGSYRNNTVWSPTVFTVSIPDYGKVVDIRVWLEFVHDGLNAGVINSISMGPFGLGGIGIALRSPNVTFDYAHPLWNDKSSQGFQFQGNNSYYNQVSTQVVPDLLRSSYLLWYGPLVDKSEQVAFEVGFNNTGTVNFAYGMWNRDASMRTVFTDSSRNRNPWHIESNYVGDAPVHDTPFLSQSAPNTVAYYLGMGFNQSPVFLINGAPFVAPISEGYYVPWFTDDRIGSGSLSHSTGSTLNNPPPGWLTGVSGTNDVNEWPTQGRNLGPTDIRPIYPLLDDIYVKKVFSDARANLSGGLPSVLPKLFGFRPGLRGTEVHGNWQLLMANEWGGTYGGNQPLTSPYTGFWFRQLRLEFTIDQGQGVMPTTYAGRRQLFRRPSFVAAKDNTPRRISVISGAASWDWGVNYVFDVHRPQFGRTVGITDQTGSFTDFAVFTRLTGALADQLAASTSSQGALYAYLHNEFGTPFIPISSGSSIPAQFSSFSMIDSDTKQLISQIIQPRLSQPVSQVSRDVLSRYGVIKKRSEQVIDALAQRPSGSF